MEHFLPMKQQSWQGTKWWNNESIEKAAVYRKTRSQDKATLEKRALRKTTRAAKKGFRLKKIEEVRQPKDIFKIFSWLKAIWTLAHLQ